VDFFLNLENSFPTENSVGTLHIHPNATSPKTARSPIPQTKFRKEYTKMMYQTNLASKYFDEVTSTSLDFEVIAFEDKWGVELHYVCFRQSIHLVLETLEALLNLCYEDCPNYEERYEDVRTLSAKLVYVLESYIAYGNDEQGLTHECCDMCSDCWEMFRR
jgi:hypothetical protein